MPISNVIILAVSAKAILATTQKIASSAVASPLISAYTVNGQLEQSGKAVWIPISTINNIVPGASVWKTPSNVQSQKPVNSFSVQPWRMTYTLDIRNGKAASALASLDEEGSGNEFNGW